MGYREKIADFFDDYVSNYDRDDERIYLKEKHTYKVAWLCEEIAKSMNLSSEDIDLAWTIGMLHDFGRFEQAKRYGTFIDSQSVDHAQFGADLLFNENMIGDLVKDEERDLIEKAIRLHNVYIMPDDLNKREYVFCNIIRDADKLDIFRVIRESSPEVVLLDTMENVVKSKISDDVYKAAFEGHTIEKSIRKTPADFVAGFATLGFELVFKRSRELALELGDFDEILNIHFIDKDTREKISNIKEMIYKALNN